MDVPSAQAVWVVCDDLSCPHDLMPEDCFPQSPHGGEHTAFSV